MVFAFPKIAVVRIFQIAAARNKSIQEGRRDICKSGHDIQGENLTQNPTRERPYATLLQPLSELPS
jgi:hypothetical protein